MASTVVVQTTFKLNDRVTAALGRMGIRAEQTGDRATRAFRRSSRAASRFGAVVKGVLVAGVIQRGFAALSMGMRSVTREFVDFDEAITRAAAKFPGEIERGTEAFKELQTAARATGATTEFTATQAATALQAYAQAGFSAEQAMALLAGTTDLATSANIEMDQAAQIATDTMGAFNLRTKDTAQAAINMARVTDVLAKGANSASLDIELLFETMSTAGAVTQLGGASIETFTTLAAKMADSALKGSVSATALKNIFIRLASPPKKAARELKKLGIVTKESNGDLRDMIDIMADVREATKGMGTGTRAATLDVLFGKRAIAGAKIVLDQTDESLRSFRKKMEDAGGTSIETANKIRKSLGNRLKVLKSTLVETGFRFLEAFVRDGQGGLTKLINAIRKFDMKPVVDGAKAALKGFKWVVTTLWDLRSVIKALVVGWLTYKIVMKAVLAFEAVKAFFLLAKAIHAAAGAQGVLNVLMAANPIGLVIVAIAALVAGIVLLIDNWDAVTAAFDVGIAQAKDLFTGFANFFKDIWVVIGSVFGSVWSEIVRIFTNSIKAFTEMFPRVTKFFADEFNKIIDTFKAVFPEVTQFFVDEFDKIIAGVGFLGQIFSSIWDSISEKVKLVGIIFADEIAFVKQTFMSAWRIMADFFSNLWDGIVKKFTFAIQTIRKGLATIGNVFGGGGSISDKVKADVLAAREARGSATPAMDQLAKDLKRKQLVDQINAADVSDAVKKIALGNVDAEVNRQAPNKAAVAAQQQQQSNINFRGDIDLHNAPPGATFTGKTDGAPPIQTNLAGANP